MQLQAEQLARRRQELIARCAAQRESLALQNRRWTSPMSVLDTALASLVRIREHPLWLAGLAVALIAIKPRRLSAALQAGSAALRTWRTIAPVMRGLRRHR